MAQKEQRTSGQPRVPNADPVEFAAMGKKQVEVLMDMQRDFIDTIEDVNREWGNRVKAEAELASEFAAKLTKAKSATDTAAIFQEWMSRRMEMFAEDSRRFVADIQRFTAASARLLPKGPLGGSS